MLVREGDLVAGVVGGREIYDGIWVRLWGVVGTPMFNVRVVR
ncbi:MAG: hypothetical protein U0768_18300 [Anaerolineae bacterium]